MDTKTRMILASYCDDDADVMGILDEASQKIEEARLRLARRARFVSAGRHLSGMSVAQSRALTQSA